MKKQSVGLGLLLMGNIVAQLPELAAWLFGVMFGIAGILVLLFDVQGD
jgi:hypothetical protein